MGAAALGGERQALLSEGCRPAPYNLAGDATTLTLRSVRDEVSRLRHLLRSKCRLRQRLRTRLATARARTAAPVTRLGRDTYLTHRDSDLSRVALEASARLHAFEASATAKEVTTYGGHTWKASRGFVDGGGEAVPQGRMEDAAALADIFLPLVLRMHPLLERECGMRLKLDSAFSTLYDADHRPDSEVSMPEHRDYASDGSLCAASAVLQGASSRPGRHFRGGGLQCRASAARECTKEDVALEPGDVLLMQGAWHTVRPITEGERLVFVFFFVRARSNTERYAYARRLLADNMARRRLKVPRGVADSWSLLECGAPQQQGRFRLGAGAGGVEGRGGREARGEGEEGGEKREGMAKDRGVGEGAGDGGKCDRIIRVVDGAGTCTRYTGSDNSTVQAHSATVLLSPHFHALQRNDVTGGTVWDACRGVAAYLCRREKEAGTAGEHGFVRGRRVLELGAGFHGLLGIVATRLGARNVVVTDGEDIAVECLRVNAVWTHMHDVDKPLMEARRLEWGKITGQQREGDGRYRPFGGHEGRRENGACEVSGDGEAKMELGHAPPFDVIVGSDLFVYAELIEPLMETLECLLLGNDVGDGVGDDDIYGHDRGTRDTMMHPTGRSATGRRSIAHAEDGKCIAVLGWEQRESRMDAEALFLATVAAHPRIGIEHVMMTPGVQQSYPELRIAVLSAVT